MLKLHHLFLFFGLLSLAYVSYELIGARLEQAEQAHQFDQALQLPPAERPENVALSLSEGDVVGRIEINRIGLSAMVQEGVAAGTLRRAVGHISTTPLPGQRGNVALAGHRDTFFRGLRDIRKNDEIILTTLRGTYHYQVDLLTIVAPEATEVIDSTNEDLLTLVTCYPFNFTGTAPHRFIVRARRRQN